MDEKFATFATTFSLNLILCHSLGDLHYEYDSSPVNHGTPSHLSIGTSSLNTATWTEGTPSFTESTMSGSLGRASADHHGQFECCWKLAQMLLWSNLSLCCIYVNVLAPFLSILFCKIQINNIVSTFFFLPSSSPLLFGYFIIVGWEFLVFSVFFQSSFLLHHAPRFL